MSTTRYYVEVITHYESGATTTRSVPGTFSSRGEAFAVAVDHGQELAGPVLEDHRRPVVAIVTDELLGVCVKVGSGDIDASYSLIYVWSIVPAAPVVPVGRGYVTCKV